MSIPVRSEQHYSFIFCKLIRISDTDSLGIATTKTEPFDASSPRDLMEKTFFPIVKPEKKESFVKKWREWLVLSDEIEEMKKPGKLKPEFSSIDAEMIALQPKSYMCYDFSKNEQKDGRKGIPNHIELELDEFRDVLYNSTPHFVDVHSLRMNKERTMTRTTTRKKGLSAIFVKQRVDINQIICSPLRNQENELL